VLTDHREKGTKSGKIAEKVPMTPTNASVSPWAQGLLERGTLTEGLQVPNGSLHGKS